ncbi:MAG TPA: hypothetical protein VMW42_10035, partial [Desulfatiglandales bacterium]|nr:hypothetical protein [Desulfatiglandales bacterium]
EQESVDDKILLKDEDVLNEDIKEKLKSYDIRIERAVDIGLAALSKIKRIEDNITFLNTSKPPMAMRRESSSNRQLEGIFEELAKKWKEETVNLSSIQKISMNNAYLQIIGLGPVAIRLILNELKRSPDFWFCALRALTRTNPVPPEMSGDLNAMTKVWLDWGQTHGYL